MILPMEKIEIIQEYMEGKSIKRIARESGNSITGVPSLQDQTLDALGVGLT